MARTRVPRIPGPTARELIEAVLGNRRAPENELVVSGAFGSLGDAYQDACVRLIERAVTREGRSALEKLLQEKTDAQLAAYVLRIAHHADVERAPGYSYRRALRNHVEELADNLSALPSCVIDPPELHADGQIRREAVAAALAALLSEREFATYRRRVADPRTRARAVSALTAHLVDRYPPPIGERPKARSDEGSRPASPELPDGLDTEAALRRTIDAPYFARRIAEALGPDLLPLVQLRLRGLKYEEIARRTGIPRATVADRLERAERRLAANPYEFGTLGTTTEALRLLIATDVGDAKLWET